jgi:thiol:disulfide interchange protein
MKRHQFLLVFFLVSLLGNAQILKPTKWSFSSKVTGDGEAELIMKAAIDEGWHLYSQFIDQGGPVPTSFEFEVSDQYSLQGGVEEKSKLIKTHDKTFDMNISFFEGEAVFVQKIKLHSDEVQIKGSVSFMLCNDQQCLPPDQLDFNIDVKSPGQGGVKQSSAKVKAPEERSLQVPPAAVTQEEPDVKPISTLKEPVSEQQSTKPHSSQHSLWAIFVAGILGGLAAFFMPCIFPMLPFTVSYFTKSQSKSNAVARSLTYGLFIIVIYVALGLLITVIFGADALNNLATNGIFNFFFFLLLVVFAFSFFGAFEIILPSSWVNKTDAQTDKGGILGLFFMAATLGIVSFSCTGPIIGTLLVEAATMGHLMGPAVGMFGFALALALPFTLFSMFPSWLKSMPKSGGWLNSVKVVLGFLELALSLKFLSNVDLAYHWNWFDREVYLVLWITIFGLMGLYLLGKVRLPHDSDIQQISPLRLFLSIIVISFTLYMIPGLWGAPLRAISAFLPPQQTQDFDLYTPTLGGHTAIAPTIDATPRKYADIFHAPYGLNAYFDYEEGLARAKKEHKPVIIDFTGHACVNCRKMEADVWSDPRVLSTLRNDYILIQLYVDDKTELPEKEQTVSSFSGKKIRTIGNKWSDFQASRFNSNSQPFYVLLDTQGHKLTEPQGADYNAESYLGYLEKGLKIFSEK